MSALKVFAMAVVSVVLLGGCAVDVENLPGTYREADGDAEIRLDADRTFVATAVPGSAVDTDLNDAAIDFSGRWEWVDSSTERDHVYLMVDDGGPSDLRGVELYVEGADAVSFIESPEMPPSLVLER